jgi:hypothetical protein
MNRREGCLVHRAHGDAADLGTQRRAGGHHIECGSHNHIGVREDNRFVHIRGTLLTVSALLCVPSVGLAQDARPVVGFQDGFFVQSADGADRLVCGLVAQVDERFSVAHPAENVIVLRAQVGL